ncbi:hypothetical protein Btru_027467 [Bulinus truncatus]|nr:hypothetical protein Btru_027467 [Bulinus truncatus]
MCRITTCNSRKMSSFPYQACTRSFSVDGPEVLQTVTWGCEAPQLCHTLNREDLLYTFHFYNEEIRSTRVPVVSMEVKLARFTQTSGVKFWPNCLDDKNNIVQVIVFNQAGQACRRLALVDNESNADRSEGQRQEKRKNRKNRRKPTLWHSTFVRSNEYTSFLLENKSQASTSVLVNYGYGSPSSMFCFNDSCSWDRKFQVPGVFALDVSLYGRRPNRNDQTLRSVLVVEEPIKGLRLLGPSNVGIKCEASWHVEFYSGSHVVYVWSVDSVAELPTTSQKFIKSFSKAGLHTVQVNVSNEVSSLQASITFQVKYPLVNVSLSIPPTILGHVTTITISIQGGSDCIITCNFGDGQLQTVASNSLSPQEVSKNDSYTSRNQGPISVIHLSHRFIYLGVYSVSVNVSNGISSLKRVELAYIEEPIGSVNLYTNSLQLPLSDELEVTAVVSSGKNLKFSWDFSDRYSNPITFSEGHTSTAKHFYSIPDRYDICVTVSNNLQPKGIKVCLHQSVDVIDKITKASIETYVDGERTNAASLVNESGHYATKKVVFKARSDGSPVQFHFDFGDGESTKIIGKEDLTRDMIADAEHVYTKGNSIVHQFDRQGSGNIFVTASNKVGILYLHEKYFVVPELTGLKVLVNTNMTAVGQEVVHIAEVMPRSAKQNILYQWTFSEDSAKTTQHRSIPFTLETTKEVHNFSYTKSGRHFITVKAVNCLSSVESVKMSILVVSQLNGLTISMTGDAVVNSSIRFKAEYWQGDFLNFTWDFGDGSFINSTHSSEVVHNYSVIGEYTVQLEAQNPVSSGRSVRKFFILNQPCNPPSVRILGNIHTASRNDLKFLRSEPVMLEAETRTNCSMSTRIKYNWQVMEPESKVVDFNFQKQDYKDMKYLEYPMLYLPPRSLKAGEYWIKLKAEMSDTVIPVYSEAETKIYISPTPIVSSIFGGAYRQVAHNDMILLDGSESYSPDNASALLRYAWSCETFPVKPYNCTETLIERNISLKSSLLVFPASWLNISISTEFIFKMKVFLIDGDDASAFSDQVVKIHPPDKKITDIYLECPQCWRNTINPDRKVSIRAHCPKCHNSKVSYNWKISRFSETKDKLLIDNPSGECVDLTDSQFHLLKLTSTNTTPVTNVTTTTIRSSENEMRHSLKLQTSPVLKSEKNTELKTKQAQSGVLEGHTETQGRNLLEISEDERIHTRKPHWADLAVSSNNKASKSNSYEEVSVHPPTVDLLNHLIPTPSTPTHVVSRDNQPIDIRSEDTLTGLDQPSLVLKPGLLKQGVAYRIDLSVTSVDGSTGMAMIYFKVNQSPMRGKCSRRPQRGFFRFFCSDWQDEHLPLLYEISYSMRKQSHEVNEPVVIYLGLRHSIDVRIPKINQQPGPLDIAVINRLGAKTSVCNITISAEAQPTQGAIESHPDVQADVVR